MAIDVNKLPEKYQRQILQKLQSKPQPREAKEAFPVKRPAGVQNGTLRYTIYGDPRTKKNHQQIRASGKKCPVCGKREKLWVGQSSQHDEYAKTAGVQIGNPPPQPIDYPVNVRCVYYMKTARRVDQLNLLEATDDILVSAGVLLDDNAKIVAAHDGSRVRYDKDNPRVEITITPFEEDQK